MTRSLPFERSWWIEPGRVIGGPYPGSQDPNEHGDRLHLLHEFGVRLIVNLQEPDELGRGDEPFPGYEQHLAEGVGLLRVPVRDMDVASADSVRCVLDAIDALEEGELAYVHCWGGHGRTGTIAGCLLRRRGHSADESFAMIAAARAHDPHLVRQPSPQTREQRALVRAWSEDTFGTCLYGPARDTCVAVRGVQCSACRYADEGTSFGAHTTQRDRHDRIRGSLLGGALGDALGHPVEFLTREEIVRRYPDGVTPANATLQVTDDTQMTLFTADGLIRAWVRGTKRGVCHPPTVMHHAYLRWLATQGHPEPWAAAGEYIDDGWLLAVPQLHARRAPGNTCLSALLGGEVGTPAEPINDSKGCGGVMRAAPCGMLPQFDPYEAGVWSAAITHGHPAGYRAAGYLAALVSRLLEGIPLTQAVYSTTDRHLGGSRGDETLAAVKAAISRASAPAADPHDDIVALGEGWIAEEALAIAIYCAMVRRDEPLAALQLAIAHSGDSDSTGAICGNILGALHGEDAWPADWLEAIDLHDTVSQVADDLALVGTDGFEVDEAFVERYPGA